MEEHTENIKKESLWEKMLESILTKKKENMGNILICGDPFSGKKELLKELKRLSNQENEIKKKGFSLNEAKSYLMDYKHLTIKKKTNENNLAMIGKLNIFIINKTLDFLQDYYNKQMFKNVVFIFNIDLAQNMSIENQFNTWKEFIYRKIKNVLANFNLKDQEIIFKGFDKTLKYIRNIKNLDLGDNRNFEKEKNNNDQDIIEEESEEEESENDDSEEENESEEKQTIKEESEEQDIIEEKKEQSEEKSLNEKEKTEENIIQEKAFKKEEKSKMTIDNFRLPIIILGNKCSKLENLDDEELMKYIVHRLKILTVAEEGFLILCDADNKINIEKLLNLLIYISLKQDFDDQSHPENKNQRKSIRNSTDYQRSSQQNIFLDDQNTQMLLNKDLKKNLEPNYYMTRLFLPFNLIQFDNKNINYQNKKPVVFKKTEIAKKQEIKVLQSFFKNISKEIYEYSEIKESDFEDIYSYKPKTN